MLTSSGPASAHDAWTWLDLERPTTRSGRAARSEVLPFALGLAGGPVWSPDPFLMPAFAMDRPRPLRLPDFLAIGNPSRALLPGELGAFTRYDDPRLGCAGPCTEMLPAVSLPSTGLASMAFIGVGVGMGLLFSAKANVFGAPPSLRFKLALRKAVATTTLRF